MKKLSLLFIPCLLLTGCSSDEANYITSVSDGNKEAIKITDLSITNDDIYHYLLENYGTNTLVTEVLNNISEKEITDQKVIDEKVKKTLEEYATYTDTPIEEYAKEQGYETVEEYSNEIVLPNVLRTLLNEKYVSDNLKDIEKNYHPKYLKTVSFDTESDALKAIESIESEADFEKVYNEKSGKDNGLVTKDSSIDENIIKELTSFEEKSLYSKAIKTSDGKYTIVFAYESKDEKATYIEKLSGISNIVIDCEAHFLDAYEFNIYEPEIKTEVENLTKK